MDDDFDFDDDSLMQAVESLERQHAASKQQQQRHDQPQAAAQEQQQQHAWPQHHPQPPALPHGAPLSTSSGAGMHQQQQQALPLQERRPLQQQQQPDMGKVWGLFCSQPLGSASSMCTGWAHRRLQRSAPQQTACSSKQQYLPGLPPQQAWGAAPPPQPRQHQQQHQQHTMQPPLQHQHGVQQGAQQPPWQQQQQQQQPHAGAVGGPAPNPPWQQQPYNNTPGGQQQQQQHEPWRQQHQQPWQQQQQQPWQQQQQPPPQPWQQQQQPPPQPWQQPQQPPPQPWQQPQQQPPWQQQQQQQHNAGPGSSAAGGGPALPAPAAAGPTAAPCPAGGSGGPAAAPSAVPGSTAAAALSGGAAAAAAAAAGGALPGASAAGAAASGGGGGPACVYNAKLTLGPKGLIEVRFSGYHKDLAAVCDGIPGAQRAPGGRAWGSSWLLGQEQVPALQQALREQLPPNLRVSEFEGLPDLVSNVLATSRRQPDDSELYDALKGLELAPGVSLEQRMMPFQREGVRFGLRAGGRLLIGDEMGLGKTVQACALAKCYQAEWPVLVVTPSSLRLSWAAALYDWLRVTEDRVLVVLRRADMERLAAATSEAAARAMYDFVVISYDLLKDVSEVLEALRFQVVILDESHCIKNGTAQRTKFAKPLVERSRRAMLLSGTPALSRPGELLSQLQALLPRARITKKAFEDRYVQLNQYSQWAKATGSKNEEELNRLLTSTVMIRRRKAEVLRDLPSKMRKQVPLLLTAAQRTELNKLKATLNDVRKLTGDVGGQPGSSEGGLCGMQAEARSVVMQLWHQTARIKAREVNAYVSDLLLNSDPEDKFLVFAFHKHLMDAIEEGVNETRTKHKELRELRYMRIDGSTDARSRDANVNRFQNEASCRVAILNIKAAGVGLTLTRASTVVFAELAWTPSEIQQAEDRAHRIGQTQSVSVHLLIVKDSIDELMWELLQNKLATTGQVLDGQAGRMEVERSSMPVARGRGAGSGGGTSGRGTPSITTFFAPHGGGGGGGPEAAAKKQRTGES